MNKVIWVMTCFAKVNLTRIPFLPVILHDFLVYSIKGRQFQVVVPQGATVEFPAAPTSTSETNHAFSTGNMHEIFNSQTRLM